MRICNEIYYIEPYECYHVASIVELSNSIILKLMSTFSKMLQIVSKNRVLRYVIYGAGTVIISEICLQLFIHLRALYLKTKNNTEINEAYFFNDLSDSCASFHLQLTAAKRLGVSNTSEFKCKNKYCSIKNIKRITDLIDSANYAIDVAIYTFTSHSLLEAFKRALKRGVEIRVVSDQEMVHSSGSQISVLADYHTPVRGPATTYMMHHKFCIIDSTDRVSKILQNKRLNKKPLPYRSTLITGSVNWTRQGFGGNWENYIVTNNKVLINSYQEEFNRMWERFDLAKTVSRN